jgi:hypothetical protein
MLPTDLKRPLEQNDARLKGWLIQQCPKGRKKFYWFLYWRLNGKLHKSYISRELLPNVRLALRDERCRVRKEQAKRHESYRREIRRLLKEQAIAARYGIRYKFTVRNVIVRRQGKIPSCKKMTS